MGPRVFGVIALTAATLCAAPVFADEPQSTRRSQQQAMRFRAMDLNGDRVITRQEWRGSDQSFRAHDWNRDGVLSGDEVRPGAQRPRRDDDDFDVQRGRQFYNWTNEGFAELDHNRDGRITPNEWHFDRETWIRADRNRDNVLTRSEFLGNPDIDMDREDRFEYLDVNNNDRIERGEWHGSVEGFTWLDRNNDGVLSRIEMLGDVDPAAESDLFTSLDVNRDGRISQNEWHWSRRSFLRQDANRDGIVSRSEFSDPTAATGTTGRLGRVDEHVIVVNSNEEWVDTGIDLLAGDTVSIEATGTVRLSGTWSDTASPAGASRRAPNAPLSNQPAGALIARVGNSAPIFIGDNGAPRTVSTGGRLSLSVNDDHHADNVGSFRVTITVRR